MLSITALLLSLNQDPYAWVEALEMILNAHSLAPPMDRESPAVRDRRPFQNSGDGNLEAKAFLQ